ncbi:SurA N-terminal domain-containing protein [Halalkalibacter sp. APA_J-10(15)]|uniref:SurA N-terminal domain-containing protein n=1 Tax=Halalkalibacter sp. APA_J-10(15) TaxID=2933805 RepID=UPI001FF37B40|nr:SurA N-terminal domain-containing protein [Halalkalibacter sp. APA_J-10(15)]MCK0471917.1 SurA N-terminal domain-containing protein [Halalkalibacter sp. APA_J-10(15)]
MKKFYTVIFSTVLALTLVACGGDEPEQVEGDVNGDNGEIEQDIDLGFNEEDIPEVIATVNGQELDRDLYIALLQQEANNLLMQGVDMGTEEAQNYMNDAKREYLEKLVDEELIIQVAEERGITATEEEVDAEIAMYLDSMQIEETELNEMLDAQGLSMDDVREDFIDLVLRAKFIDEEISTPNITEDEIEATYEELVANTGEEAPTLDEYREDIEQYLKSQKEQEELNLIIKDLKEESEIDRFV